MNSILEKIKNISEKFSRTFTNKDKYNYQKYLELEKQYKSLLDLNENLLNDINELKKENNYFKTQVEKNITKNQLINDKDFYGILDNNLTIKKEYVEYFLKCNFKYYLVLGFPFTNENKNELQEKVFRKYLQGLRERRGKDKVSQKFTVEINYIWTREKGKMKRTHYNLLINNININKNSIEYESKKWYESLKKEKLINDIELWHPTMFYIDSIYSGNNFLNSNSKKYMFKEFNIEKTEFEKNVYFIGVDINSKKYIENSKKNKY